MQRPELCASRDRGRRVEIGPSGLSRAKAVQDRLALCVGREGISENSEWIVAGSGNGDFKLVKASADFSKGIVQNIAKGLQSKSALCRLRKKRCCCPKRIIYLIFAETVNIDKKQKSKNA